MPKIHAHSTRAHGAGDEHVRPYMGHGSTCDGAGIGFSDCLLQLGENVLNYPRELDDKENLQTICT
ncbi:hypothetical protein DNTS_018075 [Danionella cerebrum]|uniref:Uncharacterized protein n=2 Tax=Danionella cerebrum TaxID=2873325 RepID=A0A553QGV3_9TELE|nr:hypothetical protein DNTS_018075 [Danionella translucida]